MSRCSYKNCSNSRSKVQGLKMFTFPPNNSEIWIKRAGNRDLIGLRPQELRRKSLCHQHFLESDILPSGRLMHGAVPIEYCYPPEEEPLEDICFIPSDSPTPEVNLAEGSPKRYPKKSSTCKHSSLTVRTLSATFSIEKVSPSTRGSIKIDSPGESRASSGNSTIESHSCASTSKIQFAPAEITSMQDTSFGSLEESALASLSCNPVYSSPADNVSTHAQGDKPEKEGEEKDGSEAIRKSSNKTAGQMKNTSSSKAKQTSMTQPKCYSRKEKESDSQEAVTKSISEKKLDAALEKLESISDKLAAASLVDSYDQFGKYISSLLRGLPQSKVLSLKQKIVLDVLSAQENDLGIKKTYSIAVQANLTSERTCKNFGKNLSSERSCQNIGVNLSSEKSCKNFGANLIPERSCKNFGVENTQASLVPTLASNIPMLGGNMPLIFPGTSSSTSSFTLLPVIPISSTVGIVSPSTNVTSSPMSTTHVVNATPLSSASEIVTTVAKSADGTLLAVTIPKSAMNTMNTTTVTQPSVTQPSVTQPRGQKRKQTAAAYLIQKMPFSPHTCTSGTMTSGESSNMDDWKNKSQISDITRTQGDVHSQQESRDSGGGCHPSPMEDRLTTQTQGDVHSEQQSRDSGGGCHSSSTELRPIPTFKSAICTVMTYRTQNQGDVHSEQQSRDSGGGCHSSSTVDRLTPQTQEDVHSEQQSRDSGGGCLPIPMEDRITKSEQGDYEIDIEEGNELDQIKQDQELFETVLCADESPGFFIKEEAPEEVVEGECEGNLNPPSPPSVNPLDTTAPLTCPLCATQCSNKDELKRHCSVAHPGYVIQPAAPGVSEHGIFPKQRL